MSAGFITSEVASLLQRRYGVSRQIGRGRVLCFGDALVGSLNYSKQLRGPKYFYAIPRDILTGGDAVPATRLGAWVFLVCGALDRVLALPASLVREMLTGVPTRRVDVFVDEGRYILQTTAHPKLDVTEYLNAYPPATNADAGGAPEEPTDASGRAHARAQWQLIRLGVAEGCSVWVPPPDRNLGYRGMRFLDYTLDRLPGFGFDEYTRRIVQNIDVLWLRRNVIRRAVEIEATTSVYSGLLRLNDLALAQPNNRIEMMIAAPEARRAKVVAQLSRPTFQPLARTCRFLPFESVDACARQIESLGLGAGTQVRGLLRGEQIMPQSGVVYPGNN